MVVSKVVKKWWYKYHFFTQQPENYA